MPTFTMIGSRTAPDIVVDWFQRVAEALLEVGWTGRSGLCPLGIDDSLTRAVIAQLNKENMPLAELYIAWDGFDGWRDGDLAGAVISAKKLPCYEKAVELASSVHPRWENVTAGGKLLHSRNPFQVLGRDLESPSDVVLLWAPISGKSITGGTRTAYELAKNSSIPIYNAIRVGEVEGYLSAIGIEIPRHRDEPQEDLEI